MNKVLTLPRHPGDVLRLVAGLAILLLCTATVRPHDVGTLETDVFRLANDLPGDLFPAFFVVMQAGNVLAVGVAAAVVAATRRFWLAANLAITGIGVWLAARWIKDQVGRERPDDLLSGTGLRFMDGAIRSTPVIGTWAHWLLFGSEFPGVEIMPEVADGERSVILEQVTYGVAVRMAVLFDNSSSVSIAREFEKSAALKFFRRVIRPEKDLAALYSVSTGVRLEQPFTSEISSLTRAIELATCGGRLQSITSRE